MEAYGNSAVEVLGKFHVFLRWKGRIYRQLFCVTTANASPNLPYRDGCYTLGVLKSCYSVDTSGTSSRFQGKPQAKPTWPTTDLDQPQMHGNLIHLSDEGTGEEKLIPLSSLSTRSNFKACHWRNRTSLECTQMYSPELGSFQDLCTSSSWNQMQNQLDMHPNAFQFIYRKPSTRKSGIWND